MSDRYPMTPTGYQRLRDELKHIREVDRPENIQDIEVARGHGDLSENAEFDAAKERQSFLDQRMRELETKLALAEIIEPTKLNGDRVKFGATVTLLELDTEAEKTYTIVGEDESDVKQGRISYTSPMARAIMAKEEGDEVVVRTPNGNKRYEIAEVTFLPINY
ncbi:MAG: transcription elongation factor GreA [Deltaproteobacteria bacterium]|nr:transcription elongation factor GreA [Deltaproteobacteria bacterium]